MIFCIAHKKKFSKDFQTSILSQTLTLEFNLSKWQIDDRFDA